MNGAHKRNQIEQVNGKIVTFLYHPKLLASTGGLAFARHFSVTFSCSERIIRRLGIGSSLAKCTDTLGASENIQNEIERVREKQHHRK